MKSFNVIKIDLKDVKSGQEADFVKSINKLNIDVNNGEVKFQESFAKTIQILKKGNIESIFVDASTGLVMFYTEKGSDYIKTTLNVKKSISQIQNVFDEFGKVEEDLNLSADDVLDLISRNGIGSLTENQLNILKSVN